MRTVAVIALKGGSGKTTVATHLALAAELRGVPSLVADIDPQHSARDALGAREPPGPPCVALTAAELPSAQFSAVGSNKKLMIVDTPAGGIEDMGEALAISDLAIMVVRPTLMDIAGLARTLSIVRRLGKPSTVVVNQAPVARVGVESPLVIRALRALDYMQASVAPAVLRSRVVYQTALERGRSAEEMTDAAAAAEVAALWDFFVLTVFGDADEESAGEDPR